MKKSYHSTVLPMQEAIATFRNMEGEGGSSVTIAVVAAFSMSLCMLILPPGCWLL
jgi:hypothetical protein